MPSLILRLLELSEVGRNIYVNTTAFLKWNGKDKGDRGVDFYISSTGVGMRNDEASIREDFIGVLL